VFKTLLNHRIRWFRRAGFRFADFPGLSFPLLALIVRSQVNHDLMEISARNFAVPIDMLPRDDRFYLNELKIYQGSGVMKSQSIVNSMRIGGITVVFAAGFLCGSMTQHNANAGLSDLGGDVIKQAGSSGGTLGTVTELGTTITDMEKHISGLQKNLDTIKKVKSMLGG